MSVIAVKGVPHKWSYGNLVRCVSQASQEEYNEFEMLNFEGAKGSKTAYVRVSEKLDPVRVVEKFNSAGNTQLEAFIPDHVPDLPPKKNLKRKFEPEKSPAHILPLTHRELLIEMQAKYSGLYNLSKKTGHKLLRQLSVSLFDRLKKLISSMGKEVATDCITLSKTYRRIYPHFGDFQFILSTLHSLQDASGAPRAQISETALMAVRHHPYLFENVTHSTVKVACKHFSDVVAKTMTEHINNLDSKVNATDSEEDVARKKVRTELKKLAPFLPLMVEQVSTKHFIPMKPRYHRISMYGENFLPPRDVIYPFLKRFVVLHSQRSTWLYNLLKFNVPPQHYSALMAMDGTVLYGAKLVIRSSDTPKYKIPLSVYEECIRRHAVGFYAICESIDKEMDEFEDEEMEGYE